MKKAKKKKKPAIFVLTTISQKNQYTLLDTVREAEKLKPDGMVMYYSWFTKNG